jgi:hypothetical protein
MPKTIIYIPRLFLLHKIRKTQTNTDQQHNTNQQTIPQYFSRAKTNQHNLTTQHTLIYCHSVLSGRRVWSRVIGWMPILPEPILGRNSIATLL